MKHPFETLRPEYSQLLAAMTIRKECREAVDHAAVKLLCFKSRYQDASAATGVPIVFIGPSFELEAASDFKKNPAQGWPLTSVSKIIPHNGPFPDWKSAAIAAYHLNGLDKVGDGNWTWEHLCFYGELFNGMGYRDFHHMHTPYLWAGTNIQTIGKYISDGKFDPSVMSTQIGLIPLARRMAEIDPTLALTLPIPIPSHSGLAAPDTGVDTTWVQEALNKLGHDLGIDGNYGDQTKKAVESFQRNFGITIDGLAGSETVQSLISALKNLEADTEKLIGEATK